MKKICENCKYGDYDLFKEPCASCFIPDINSPDFRDNQNWEPKEDE